MRRSVTHYLSVYLSFVAAMSLGVMLSGCAGDGGGKLNIRSQTGDRVTLAGGFDTGIYSFGDNNQVTVVLFDGPVDNPRQAVTIRLFWAPRAGRTPIDSTATNATIHYMIFAGEDRAQAGVYSGAGFVYPRDTPGDDRLRAGVWEASLRLRDSSEGFDDRLGQAMLQGNFSARRDDVAVQQALRRMNILLRDRLGYPRLVDATPRER